MTTRDGNNASKTQKAGNKWLDRAGFFGTQLTLCTTEAMFRAEYKRLTGAAGLSIEWCPTGGASRHVLVQVGRRLPCQIITIDAAHEHMEDSILVAAMLAHEVVHVKQETMRVIGETSPSDEFEAYFVQNMLYNVLEEYARQTGLAE
jgi:hypothetical protein